MFESLKTRFAIIGAALFLGLMYLVPNFAPLEAIPWWPAKNKLVYGLDIQGGLHLVLEASVDDIVQDQLLRLSDRLKKDMKKAKIAVSGVSLAKTAPTACK